MDKASFEALLTKYGKDIFIIGFDNSRTLYLQYPNSPKVSDLSVETIGTTDFLKVNRMAGSLGGHCTQISVTEMIPLETLQYVLLGNDEKLMPDMNLFN